MDYDYEELYNKVIEMSMEERKEFLEKNSKIIIPQLNMITKNQISGTSILATFMIGSVVADGKIEEEEYELLYPHLKNFFGEDFDYNTCKEAAKKYRKEREHIKTYVDDLIDILGEISEGLKTDIIFVCMIICAIDGKVSLRERLWIKKLIKK